VGFLVGSGAAATRAVAGPVSSLRSDAHASTTSDTPTDSENRTGRIMQTFRLKMRAADAAAWYKK
jgi:hypothetical protein